MRRARFSTAKRPPTENGAKRRQPVDYFVVGWYVPKWDNGIGLGASVMKPAERPRGADNDRREIAKRIFDALCAQYPLKYIALVQPRDPTPAVPNENWSGISQMSQTQRWLRNTTRRRVRLSRLDY
jgi:hypothetical protein